MLGTPLPEYANKASSHLTSIVEHPLSLFRTYVTAEDDHVLAKWGNNSRNPYTPLQILLFFSNDEPLIFEVTEV